MASAPPSGMIGRIMAILTKPREEFARIDAESMTVGGIMTGWVVPLAAIPAVAGLIGTLAIVGGLGPIVRASTTWLIGNAVLNYALALVGAYVCALVIDTLAPSFGAQKNPVQAMKAFAYSMTAAWVAGIVLLIPLLGLIWVIAALYSCYLLYVALPIMMKVPADKAVGYFVVILVVAIVVMWVVGTVANVAANMILPGAPVLNLRM